MQNNFLETVGEFFNVVSNRRYAPRAANEPGGNTPPPTSGGRRSIPDDATGGLLANATDKYKTVNHQFMVETIPVIRNLVYSNEDLSQALHNIISLGNTGHKVYFDRNVSPEEADKMRRHLSNKKKIWASGQAGMHGVVNKMFAQAMISGALSNEWVPNTDLSGINKVAFVNPEQIYFVLASDRTTYIPFQKPKGGYWTGESMKELIRLNPNTYRYFAINGDTDIPYGIPPYLPTLGRVKSQRKMLNNIDFIIDQLSLIGFLEVLVQKPDEIDGISDESPAFESKLSAYLNKAKAQLDNSLRDGIVVGFKDDHDFKFNSFGKDLEKAIEIFKNNEYLLASGLKQDLTLMGRDGQTSETQITVIFMKLLSELRNIQNIIKENLEFGYGLELRLAGFNFEYIKVEFNRSTIQDDLKYQQAEEIKIRNVTNKRLLGIINQDQAADELGYETPSSEDAIIPWELIAGRSVSDGTAEQKDKDTKNKSAKGQRDKNKPVTKDK